MPEKEPVHFSIIDNACGVDVNGRRFGSSIIRSHVFLIVSGVPNDSCGACPLRYGNSEGYGGKKRPYVMCSQRMGMTTKKEYERFMESEVQPPDYQIAIKISCEPNLRSQYVQIFAGTALCADRQNSNIDAIVRHFSP